MKNILHAAAMGLTLLSGAAMADGWPERGINLTVSYSAGGTTDSTARVLAALLESELDTTVTVVNKPGGGGSVAAALASAQRPDGYNIFTYVTGAAVISPHRQDLPYDPLEDFTFISQYGAWNLGIVVPADAPYQTFDELVAYAKDHPGEISYAISGTGTPQHLTMVRLGNELGVDWKPVPFKGGAPSVTALIGGHVDIMAGATEWLPQVRSGEFKLIAMLTGSRMEEFPDVPTLKDLGHDIEAPSILGIAGPAGIPDEARDRLDDAIAKAAQSPELKEIFDTLAMRLNYLDSADFERNVRENHDVQGEIIRAAGLGK
ncbi:Bug family tripartite tricarboxylate transporter substrate binding protein [Microbulbifer sp. S227A]|uniref:Bug family tripartite tricarboxylate transporter substrate binding protein n=1 Tax=Microbulbifer sp. S227A TaxID=3415131 RepID=UPI003C7C1BE0